MELSSSAASASPTEGSTGMSVAALAWLARHQDANGQAAGAERRQDQETEEQPHRPEGGRPHGTKRVEPVDAARQDDDHEVHRVDGRARAGGAMCGAIRWRDRLLCKVEDAPEDGRKIVGQADDADGEVRQDAIEPQRQKKLEGGHAEAALEAVDLADDRVAPAREEGRSRGWCRWGGVGMGVGRGADAGSDGAGGPRAEQADYTPSLHTGGAPPGGSGLSARQGAGCTCGFPLVHRAAASPGCP